jgi:hypothetical protein
MKTDLDFSTDDFIDIPNTQKSIHHDKRMARKKGTAEDFTPPKLTNEMLDKLPKEVWSGNKTFCDPACGNGNMLIEVLKRKLSFNHDPIEALKSIYGCDIMEDNIKEARLRLLKIILNHTNKKPTIELIKILGKNIVCTPLSNPKYPNGSLDYDFEFSYTPTDLQAKQGLDKILREKLLDQVSIS